MKRELECPKLHKLKIPSKVQKTVSLPSLLMRSPSGVCCLNCCSPHQYLAMPPHETSRRWQCMSRGEVDIMVYLLPPWFFDHFAGGTRRQSDPFCTQRLPCYRFLLHYCNKCSSRSGWMKRWIAIVSPGYHSQLMKGMAYWLNQRERADVERAFLFIYLSVAWSGCFSHPYRLGHIGCLLCSSLSLPRTRWIFSQYTSAH